MTAFVDTGDEVQKFDTPLETAHMEISVVDGVLVVSEHFVNFSFEGIRVVAVFSPGEWKRAWIGYAEEISQNQG